eukprot:c13686_g1_i2.p1 GENE.c13686_g1_i2~~c13686_g1_i2.p1  ORF type:complete len:395 (+),score=100.15 c13686_g1_i2:41-1186(+)
MRGFRVCFFVCILFQATVLGWWDTGHMMVAQVAQLQLSEADIDSINDVLSDWNYDFPDLGDLISAAVWPDVIKCTAVSSYCPKLDPDAIGAFTDWHFGDQPYNPDGLPLTDSQKNGWTSNPSIIWILQQTLQTFSRSKTRFAFNLHLRYTLHFLGDLHQPLHAVGGYFNDSAFGNLTNGDQGGNLVKLHTPWNSITNLHSLWDAAGAMYFDGWPFNQTSKDNLLMNATMLTAKYAKNSSVIQSRYIENELDSCWGTYSACKQVFLRWFNESHSIAIESAYPTISQNCTPSDTYLENARNISQLQIVLGGYRLGDILKKVASLIRALPYKKPHSTNSDWTLNNTAKIFLGLTCLFSTLFLIAIFRLSTNKPTKNSKSTQLLE